MTDIKSTHEASDDPEATHAHEVTEPRLKVWLAPKLTVHSIDAVTMGTRTSTRSDGGFGDNYIS